MTLNRTVIMGTDTRAIVLETYKSQTTSGKSSCQRWSSNWVLKEKMRAEWLPTPLLLIRISIKKVLDMKSSTSKLYKAAAVTGLCAYYYQYCCCCYEPDNTRSSDPKEKLWNQEIIGVCTNLVKSSSIGTPWHLLASIIEKKKKKAATTSNSATVLWLRQRSLVCKTTEFGLVRSCGPRGWTIQAETFFSSTTFCRFTIIIRPVHEKALIEFRVIFIAGN